MKIGASVFAVILCLVGSAANAGDRFPELQLDQMTPDQKKIAEAILSGPRKSLVGPFNAWLRSPDLASRLQQVGEYIRFSGALPPRLRELAILINAREWSAQFAWYAHYTIAVQAGLDPRIADEIAVGRRPADMKSDEKAVYDFCIELHRTRNVTDATYNTAVAILGEQGVMDLIGVSGYYDLVAMTLNVAQVKIPPEAKPLLPLNEK